MNNKYIIHNTYETQLITINIHAILNIHLLLIYYTYVSFKTFNDVRVGTN